MAIVVVAAINQEDLVLADGSVSLATVERLQGNKTPLRKYKECPLQVTENRCKDAK